MGRIATFYSYKGGVGRSMALANVALLLAQRGLKVLAVDCDLEAPGLERYFSGFVQRETGPGLLRMVADARTRRDRQIDYLPYCGQIETDTPHQLTLLASGREQDSSYSQTLEHFDWEGLFASHGGGELFETLRMRWREDFDIVLIDSRTGLSDTGGICTIQLPDVVVAMFTANFQSLYGVRDVMRLAQQARQGLAYDRMPLTVLPLPARWGMQEFQETQVWLDRVVDGVGEFFDDWLPRPHTARDVVERLRLPQQDFFGFGEKLAVVEQGVASPGSLGFIYDRVASILAKDFSDIATVLGMQAPPACALPHGSGGATSTVSSIAAPPVTNASITNKAASGRPMLGASTYDYDVYVSFHQSSADWTLQLVAALKAELALLLGSEPQFFVDLQEVAAGELWASKLDHALQRSRTLLCVITPRYVASEWTQRELHAFVTAHAGDRAPPVVSVMLRRTELPPVLESLIYFDLTDVPMRSGFGSNVKERMRIRDIADGLAQLIKSTPPLVAG